MPLIKSKSDKARQANIRTEIASGKEPMQAVAIGYSVQRRAENAHVNRQAGKRAARHARGGR